MVVTGSSCSASQYMNYMNVFFTAQKQNVVIDVCALDQHLSLLQQGCDITNGLYLKVPQLQGLLQYLLVCNKYFSKFVPCDGCDTILKISSYCY